MGARAAGQWARSSEIVGVLSVVGHCHGVLSYSEAGSLRREERQGLGWTVGGLDSAVPEEPRVLRRPTGGLGRWHPGPSG